SAELTAQAADLQKRYGILTRTGTLDLGRADLLDAVRTVVEDREVGLLVYNAALTLIGPFLSQPLPDLLRIIDVNCPGPVILAHELGPKMAARARGGIILMSSLTGSQGSPYLATYGATKAFNLVLAEALWDELRQMGIDVLSCRAGSIRTPGYERS